MSFYTSKAVYLLDTKNNRMVEAEVCFGITDTHICDWQEKWCPSLRESLEKLKEKEVDFFPQSAHWDWNYKHNKHRDLLSSIGVSVVCLGVTQGMMYIDLSNHRCRLSEQENKNLVYVEYLENAPWNRKELLFDPPAYKGIGAILFTVAIEISKEEGFKGRIGLHSLPQANNWYKQRCGMTNLGMDSSVQNLNYFEMNSVQANEFLERNM